MIILKLWLSVECRSVGTVNLIIEDYVRAERDLNFIEAMRLTPPEAQRLTDPNG